MFITFEGLDLSGKSTQAQRLLDRLQRAQYPAVLIREPGGTAIGEKVRTVLLDRTHDGMDPRTEFLLFSASRAQLVCEVIRPALAGGTVVISDRFFDSSSAYQGGGRGLPLEEIDVINRHATAGLKPDVTFLLDVPIPVLEARRRLSRPGVDRMEANDRTFYERVRKAYLDLAAREQRIVVLDGTASVEELEQHIWTMVAPALPELQKRV